LVQRRRLQCGINPTGKKLKCDAAFQQAIQVDGLIALRLPEMVARLNRAI
jgi:hypothetical protein